MAWLQKSDLFFMVTSILLSLEAIEPNDTICPIGFRVAYKKHGDKDPICYRQKGPEAFADKFKDCVGNLFNLDLYEKLNITKPNLVFWTDYKSSYPGGRFVDWSYTKKTGNPLTREVEGFNDASPDYEEMCIVSHPETDLTVKRCEEKHDRYCFVEPYNEMPSSEGCESLKQSLRFWSPLPTCLTLVSGGRTDLPTWQQSQDICVKRGGSLLYEGWRYSNNPFLLNGTTASRKNFPLSVLSNSSGVLMRIDSENNYSNISSSEWKFENSIDLGDVSYGSVKEDLLYYVNRDETFKRFICEKPVEPETAVMRISLTKDYRMALSVNVVLSPKDIMCFTDSFSYDLRKTRQVIKDKMNNYLFFISPILNNSGYYWCIHTDLNTYYPSESNKILYISQKNTDELLNLYAVQIRLDKPYKLKDLSSIYEGWWKSLEQYIFIKTEYEKVYGKSLDGTKVTEKELKDFKNEKLELTYDDKSIIEAMKIKQVYRNQKTVLVHVKLNENIQPVISGSWDNLEVISMKPAYYCSALKLNGTKKPYGTMLRDGCIKYSCVGDFNHGVQWIETVETTTPSTRKVTLNVPTVDPLQDILHIVKNDSESSEETEEYYSEDEASTAEYTIETILTLETVTVVEQSTDKSTKPPRPPITVIPTTEVPTTTEIPTTTEEPELPLEDKLEQAMDNLDSLMTNDSTIMINNISDAFTKVDEILAVEDDNLAIPGRLLNLLDELGARIYLNGSRKEMAVRENIALLVTDASPNNPVRGLRIASTDSEVFKEDAFEIINEQIDDANLTAEGNDLVVQLPLSVAESSRRISFVVFRNDRAFQTNHGLYMVNSRVLSVNVENLTEFNEGEVIDIHLSPNRGIPEVNESRACAFWEFLGNETGQWSQRGCTFIPATRPGLLDTCRCNHLTHFAEILIPSDFSQTHQDILEIISIVGCVLSIFGLALVGITAALFRSWRRDFNNKIWFQLCIAIFLLSLCFLIIALVKFNKYDVICMILGVVLHYSVLASFCWMLVAAILSYRRLVMVFTRDASHKLLRAAAFAWGLPCAIVGILLSAAPQSYQGRFDDKTPSASFCYPTGLAMWLAVYAPIAIMLLVNWTLFVLIVRSVFASTRIQRHGDSNEALRCASVSCLLVFLFGLPWIFGLFAYNVVAAYFFTLTATFQGFVLFMFFVVGNKKTRDLWLNKLKIKQTRKVPVTSSTYTNRSTGPSRSAGPASMEVKFSKPRSLASPDDSRFS